MKEYRTRYRVIWVDEEEDTMKFAEMGRRYDLEIQQFRSWDRARAALMSRFDSVSALVLDGRCVVNEGEAADADFLYQVVREMAAIFAHKEELIPWYVLSSGSAPDFESTLRRIGKGVREQMEPEWGRMYYRKWGEMQELCQTIRHATGYKKDNKIRTMYREVFAVLNRHFPPDSRQTMLDILKALHFPEEKRNFDAVLYYTQLRRILEHLFRAANRIGVLPDEVMGSADKVNLANSSLYMAGRDVNIGNRTVRYKKPGSYIFPPITAQIVKSLLYVANKNSHTVELDKQGKAVITEYYKTMHSNNFLFGFTMHLCDVLIWFGDYAQHIGERNQSS